jgi:undecaprenyl-diphosphatase
MGILDAIILGIVQGLTEFLPISSSGHLVLAQHFLGVDKALLDEAILFDLTLHFGTVLAVIYCYWNDITGLLSRRQKTDSDSINETSPLPKRLLLMFVISITATAIIAFPMQEFLVKAFTDARFAAYGLLITAGILTLSLLAKGNKKISDIKPLSALIIGVGQGIAVFPGISRSGTTIVTGMLLGIKAKDAARYSFLLSVPTILLANLVQFKDVLGGESLGVSVVNYIVGFMAAAIFGVLAIKIILRVLTNGKLAWFAIYCVVAGVTALLLIK